MGVGSRDRGRRRSTSRRPLRPELLFANSSSGFGSGVAHRGLFASGLPSLVIAVTQVVALRGCRSPESVHAAIQAAYVHDAGSLPVVASSLQDLACKHRRYLVAEAADARLLRRRQLFEHVLPGRLCCELQLIRSCCEVVGWNRSRCRSGCRCPCCGKRVGGRRCLSAPSTQALAWDRPNTRSVEKSTEEDVTTPSRRRGSGATRTRSAVIPTPGMRRQSGFPRGRNGLRGVRGQAPRGPVPRSPYGPPRPCVWPGRSAKASMIPLTANNVLARRRVKLLTLTTHHYKQPYLQRPTRSRSSTRLCCV